MKIKNALLALFGILLTVSAFAQDVPNAIRFQTILRDANGELVSERNVGIRITIFSKQQEDHDLYGETFAVKTTADGIATVVLGEGEKVLGLQYPFEDIWNEANLWMRVEIDPNGGTEYSVISGESQLLSVPYAFRAKTAENAEFAGTAYKAERLGNMRFAKVKVTIPEGIPASVVPNIKLGGNEVAPGQKVEVLAYTPTYLSVSYPEGYSDKVENTTYRLVSIKVNGKELKGQLTDTKTIINNLKLPVKTDEDGAQYAVNEGIWSDAAENFIKSTVYYDTNNTYEFDVKKQENVDVIVGPFVDGQENVIEIDIVGEIF